MRTKTLYRTISFVNFIQLLDCKVEFYRNPLEWADSYEGCGLQLIDNELNRKQFLAVLSNQYADSDHRIDAILDNYVKAEVLRYCCFAQCWTRNNESSLIWDAYSYGNQAIQITSDAKRINEVLSSNGIQSQIKEVVYDVNASEENAFLKFYEKGMDFKDQIFHKRMAFKDEEEYRVLFMDEKANMIFRTRLNTYRKALFEDKNNIDISKTIDDVYQNNPYKFSKTYSVHIDNPANYIKNVRVHPRAETWYVDLVKKICADHGIAFGGQSNLYS